MKQWSLSASSVGVFEDCPRCFWYDKVKGIARPRGIFPSLPGGVDKKLKVYFDKYRLTQKNPIELEGPDTQGFSLYPDVAKLNRWRNWKTGLFIEAPKWKLIGALDDLLYNPSTKLYAALDYKTKGSGANQADVEKYYSRQMDFYSLLLLANGYNTDDFGVIISYSPFEFSEGRKMEMDFQVFKLDSDPTRAKTLLDRAADCLNSFAPPQPSDDCGYCDYAQRRANGAL